MNRLRIIIYKKLQFVRSLKAIELFKYFFDFFKYKRNSFFKTHLRVNEIGSYSTQLKGIRIKSPSPRLLKLMKVRYLTKYNLSEQKKYFKLLNIKDGTTIIDVGANIGYYSIIYSFLFPNSKILSFEPSILNFSYLKYHKRQRKNISIFNVGLHHKKDKSKIQMPTIAQNSSVRASKDNSGLLSMYGKSSNFVEEIDLDSFDKLYKQFQKDYSPISFMKIDVEGNELHVIKGAQRMIKFYSPILEIEINNYSLNMAGYSPDDIFSFLEKLGYSPFEYKNSSIEPLSVLTEPIQTVIFINN